MPLPAPRTLTRLAEERILITGAGGSIGSALALRIAALAPSALVLYDISESRMAPLQTSLRQANPHGLHRFVLGSVLDHSLLDETFEIHRPTLVFHAAAYKHVPLLENQPLAAIENNLFGTGILTAAAARHHARVIFLSTDKAVEPASIMGATKRVAERIILGAGGTAMRLGNVLASSGSVVELFAAQIAAGGPVTVTDPAARRYFLTIDEAVNLLIAAYAEEPGLYVPALEKQHFIADLARFMAGHLAPRGQIRTEFTTPRAGDKECEKLWAATEHAAPCATAGLLRTSSSADQPADLERELRLLRVALEARDLPAALSTMRRLVPDFTPSPALQSLAEKQASRANA